MSDTKNIMRQTVKPPEASDCVPDLSNEIIGECVQDVSNEIIKETKEKITFIRVIKSEYFLYCISLAAFFSAWHWAAVTNTFGTSALASPFEVLESLWSLVTGTLAGKTLWDHMWISTYRVILGFLIAAVFGIPFGLCMAYNETFRLIAKPIFDIFKPMPPLAWISVAILWFGIGEAPKIFIIIIGAFVPVVLNSFNSVSLIDPELYDAVRVMGGSRWDEIRLVSVPGALPALTAGLQIAMSASWASVVAAELVNANAGIGFILMRGMRMMDPGMIIGGMIVIAVIALVFTQLMDFIRRRLAPWQREITNF